MESHANNLHIELSPYFGAYREKKRKNRVWERVCRSKIPSTSTARAGILKENMDTVCGSLASQPASQLASHRGTCFFPLLSPLAFYLISSPLVAPLSPAFTHVCQRKGRSCGVCAHKRLYSVASRLCASLYARASVSHMRMSR